MNLIISILDVLELFIKTIFKIFTPIFIIIFVLIVFKIIYRYKKYGKSEFSVFKTHEKAKFIDIVIDIIKKIDIKAKLIQNNNLYSDIVLVNKTGIYLLKVIKFHGLINGKRTDKTLTNKIKNNIEEKIDNPFYYLEKDKDKILNIDNSLVIHTILVINNNVSIIIDNVNQKEIINLQNFYYTMENYLKSKSIYNEEEINKIINSIKE